MQTASLLSKLTVGPLRALLIVAAIGIACGFCFKAAAENGGVATGDLLESPADDDFHLTEEASRRAIELSSQTGFRVWGPLDNPMQIELDVPRPRPDQCVAEVVSNTRCESMISLWFETVQGMFAMELLGPEQKPVVSWQGGRRGEQSLIRVLDPGKYVLKLRAMDGAHVRGIIGIKVLPSACPIGHQLAGGKLVEHQADPGRGYSWPYLLIMPARPSAGTTRLPGADRLLVVPNNSASPTEDLRVLRAFATCALNINNPGDINPLELQKSLGTPILMPLFPRPELKEIASNLQLQALSRASFLELPPRFARLDLQLMAMIDAARKELAESQPVRQRVLMAGLSAAGSFTNRFTVLHPERVLAAAVGSPSGWPIAPVAFDQGKTLRYPVGIADAKMLIGSPVDLAALRRVHFLFFLGDTDTNDAVGSRDSYSVWDSKLIKCLFGRTLVERWRHAQRLYDRAGLRHVQFKVYPGGHKVTPEMRKDILETFRKAVAIQRIGNVDTLVGRRRSLGHGANAARSCAR